MYIKIYMCLSIHTYVYMYSVYIHTVYICKYIYCYMEVYTLIKIDVTIYTMYEGMHRKRAL